ncbi:MAG: hypothetical protein PSN34_08560 [Urechidicola sp.]|nr:hypothetical protein [Urechidicola sp.]
MKILKSIIVLFILIFFIGCSEEEEKTSGDLQIGFTHKWDEIIFRPHTDIDNYYPAYNIDSLRITKLRYHISNIVLITEDGTEVFLKDYVLVSPLNSDAISSNNPPVDPLVPWLIEHSFNIPNVPFNDYRSLSFTFGFNETDNINGAYSNLNTSSLSWYWPEELGGGYHFLQLEGEYSNNSEESNFEYNMGKAKVSEGVFEPNSFNVHIYNPYFSFPHTSEISRTILIEMNLAEWFRDPTPWDLNIYNQNLMDNYDAQTIMNQNGRNVFSMSVTGIIDIN